MVISDRKTKVRVLYIVRKFWIDFERGKVRVPIPANTTNADIADEVTKIMLAEEEYALDTSKLFVPNFVKIIDIKWMEYCVRSIYSHFGSCLFFHYNFILIQCFIK